MSTTKEALRGMLSYCGSDAKDASAVVCATIAPRCREEFATNRYTLSVDVVTFDEPRDKYMLVRR